MTGPIQRVLAALREHGREPKRAGAGWACRCPAHDDRAPSLSIATGDDGRALVNCHAGCPVDAVCGAIGLRASDLFAPDLGKRNGHAPRVRASAPAGGRTFPTARDAAAELERRHGPRSALWTYHDAAGEPVGVVVRWNTPTGKDVRPVSKTPAGWIIGGMPEPRPLYALPDLLATPAGTRIYVTEGEKAADAARACGLTATTSPHGSKSASKADWSPVAGRDVVVLPDHDGAGERYAADVARLATAAGAKSVRVVRLVGLWAGLPRGGDMADLVEHRGGDVDPIRADVEALADKTEPEVVTPEAPAVPAFAPFPVDALPEPIREYVLAAAEAIFCDPAYVASPMLAALAGAIGNTVRIRLKATWTEPAIVWAAVVCDSGAGKSPAMDAAMRWVRDRQHAAMLAHKSEVEARAAAGDDGPPPAPRHYTADTTTEGLAVLLQRNPRGMLLCADELATWFGGHDRYTRGRRGGDSARWLEMHGGRPIIIDRKTDGELYVPRASVSVTGTIQPGTLARFLGREHFESGMAARTLLAMPPRHKKVWSDQGVPEACASAVGDVFSRLYDLPMDGPDDDPRPRLVDLDASGMRAWIAYYREHSDEQYDLAGDEAACWAKLEGYTARLALVIHMVRWAAGDPAVLMPTTPIDERSIAAGVVLSRWFGQEALRVYAVLGESDGYRGSHGDHRLVEWIRGKGGVVTVRDLTHGVRAYRGDPVAAERALSRLAADGIGTMEWGLPGSRGGRPTKQFRLVGGPETPTRVTETPAGDPANGGFDSGDTGDTPADAGDGWGEL